MFGHQYNCICICICINKIIKWSPVEATKICTHFLNCNGVSCERAVKAAFPNTQACSTESGKINLVGFIKD